MECKFAMYPHISSVQRPEVAEFVNSLSNQIWVVQRVSVSEQMKYDADTFLLNTIVYHRILLQIYTTWWIYVFTFLYMSILDGFTDFTRTKYIKASLFQRIIKARAGKGWIRAWGASQLSAPWYRSRKIRWINILYSYKRCIVLTTLGKSKIPGIGKVVCLKDLIKGVEGACM